MVKLYHDENVQDRSQSFILGAACTQLRDLQNVYLKLYGFDNSPVNVHRSVLAGASNVSKELLNMHKFKLK